MQVKIANVTPQLLRPTVVEVDGSLREIRLEGRRESDPVDDATISAHTRQLVEAGHLKIRPA